MKKAIGFCIVVCLLLTAATGLASEEAAVTMEDILAANTAEHLLEQYQSVHIDIYYPQEEIQNATLYVDESLAYSDDAEYAELLSQLGCYYYSNDEYCGYILLDTEEEATLSYYQNLGLDVEGTLEEEILSIEQEDDLLVVTTRPAEESASEILEDCEEGCYVQQKYWMDPDTLAMQKCEGALMHTDGSSDLIYRYAYQYDAPIPENAQAMLQRLQDTDQLRTVTVTVDPDTDQEITRTATVLKGEKVYFYSEDLDAYHFYTDRECTQPFESDGDVESDKQLFLTTD